MVIYLDLVDLVFTIKKAQLDFDSSEAGTANTAKAILCLIPVFQDVRLYISNCIERGPRGDISSICKTIWCLNIRGSLELKLEIIARIERDTSGPQRTSKKYFPSLITTMTISYCVSDTPICNKSQRENTDGGRREAAIHHVLR